MKRIGMTVTTNEKSQDVFRLKTEPEHIDVILTEDSGTTDLPGSRRLWSSGFISHVK